MQNARPLIKFHLVQVAPFSLVGVAMITDGYVVSSVIYGLLVELVNDISSHISSTIHGGSDQEEADYCEE